jgi:LisH
VELKDIGMGQSFHRATDEEAGASGSQLCQKAVNSLIADHLKHSNYNYTLSIFLPEAGATQESVSVHFIT